MGIYARIIDVYREASNPLLGSYGSAKNEFTPVRF